MDGVFCVFYRELLIIIAVSETMSDEWNNLNQTQILVRGGVCKKNLIILAVAKLLGKVRISRGVKEELPWTSHKKKFSSK